MAKKKSKPVSKTAKAKKKPPAKAANPNQETKEAKEARLEADALEAELIYDFGY